MVFRCIAPPWLRDEQPTLRRVYEGEFTPERLEQLNALGYNIYFLPNYPGVYTKGETVDGSKIDVFRYVFVDYDLKSGRRSKSGFLVDLQADPRLSPTIVVDSGNGVHAYWEVTDLDAVSYLKLQRRLCRHFDTDEAVSQIYQLMRAPGYNNTKQKDAPKPCVQLDQTDNLYTCEELDRLLPPLTAEDAQHCQQHYDKTYGLTPTIVIDEKIPLKFEQLIARSNEASEIWKGNVEDRSTGDYRLGHLMYAAGLTKDEAMSVLVNTQKAVERAPQHRVTYATNIVDKVWAHETLEYESKRALNDNMSPTVRELLSKSDDTNKGERFPCNRILDDTEHGFRLGQVIGIIGGSGVGKTTLTLNSFLWFAELNPNYQHFFFSLEQPPGEIACRIRTICGTNDALYDKIHIVSNYNSDGSYKHLSMLDIEKHLTDFQTTTGKKVGAVVIDHIGVLSKSDKHGESEGLMGICRQMKATAVNVNILLMMLSQAPREKAGIGDLELNKDAAFGTVFFESFVDFCLCLWQPLKRAYEQGAPTVMAFKFAKIRHKQQKLDKIREDICYQLYFDPVTERLRELTEAEEIAARHFLNVATNRRKLDRKTDLIPYESRRVDNGTPSNDHDVKTA